MILGSLQGLPDRDPRHVLGSPALCNLKDEWRLSP